jgi:hypothetical protein
MIVFCHVRFGLFNLYRPSCPLSPPYHMVKNFNCIFWGNVLNFVKLVYFSAQGDVTANH